MNLLRNRKFLSVIFDAETEGLNLLYSRPWQLSYTISEGNEIKEEYDKFIWWEDLKVSADAARVTRFDYNNYKRKAEAPEKVLEHFDRLLYNDKYLNIGQNSLGFDIFIHNILRKLCGKSPDWSYLERSYDTNCLAKAIKYKNPPQIEDNKLKWQYKLMDSYEKGIKTNLKTLCADNDIFYDENLAHDGKYDVDRTIKVFNKQIFKLDI